MKTCMLMALQASCQLWRHVPQTLKLYHWSLSWRQIKNILVVFIEWALLKACSWNARVRKGRQRCVSHHHLRLGFFFFPPARSAKLSGFLSQGVQIGYNSELGSGILRCAQLHRNWCGYWLLMSAMAIVALPYIYLSTYSLSSNLCPSSSFSGLCMCV